MGRRERYGIAALVALASLGAYLIVNSIPGEQPVEFDLKAGQGTTSFSLAPEANAVSPGCGCSAPEFGKHPWEGMSVPSTGFDLSVDAPPTDDIARQLWSLTVLDPDTGTINWYGEPSHSLRMHVVAKHGDGSRSVLFNGAASHFVLWTDEAVKVRQPVGNPYAAVLPAADGSTSFSSHEASRASWGAKVDIASEVPARPQADPSKACTDPEVGQRGAMVDVLGPTVRFSVPYTSRLRMWTAQKEVPSLHPGDSLTVSITTPFALRLIAHPVQRDWQGDLPNVWHRKLQKALTKGGFGSLASRGPLLQERLLLKEPLPPYVVRLIHLQAPRMGDWTSFARRSARRAVIPPMAKLVSLDGNAPTWEEHALPPISSRPQIGVFGRITAFDSTGVGGHAVIGSGSRPIARGQELRFHSDEGLGAGTYRLTPLVSSGQETVQASVFGTATVWIGGSVASHPGWFPWVPFGALVGAIVGFFAAGALRWVHHGSLGSTSD